MTIHLFLEMDAAGYLGLVCDELCLMVLIILRFVTNRG